MRRNKSKVANGKSVTILKDSSTGEFRVPGPAGTEAQAYYTDDKSDALGTAKRVFGDDVSASFRSVPDFDKFQNSKGSKEFREGYDAGFSGKARTNPYHNNTNHSATPEQQSDWLTGYVYGSNAKAQNKPSMFANAAGEKLYKITSAKGNLVGRVGLEVAKKIHGSQIESIDHDGKEVKLKASSPYGNASFQNGCSKALKEIENKAGAAGLKFGNVSPPAGNMTQSQLKTAIESDQLRVVGDWSINEPAEIIWDPFGKKIKASVMITK